MSRSTTEHYIPALRFGWLTSLYDPIIAWTLREATFKRRLVEQAGIKPGHRVLDVGCGTATLSILIKQAHTDAEVIGLDGDHKILEIARSKVTEAGVKVALEQGMAFDLPYSNDSFDRVVCTLLLHHLTRENKVRTLNEVFRVLRPGGELHVADFGKPQNALMYTISLVTRRFEEATDNVGGFLTELFRKAGFDPVEETARYMTIMGTLALYRAKKPA